MQIVNDLTRNKQLIKILVASVVLGLALIIFDFVETQLNFDGNIERKSAGLGNYSEEFEVSYGDEKSDIDVVVSDIKLSEEEALSKLEDAVSEINETYLGENISANEIYHNLFVEDSYVDGLVEAQWKFDQIEIISRDGKINHENIPIKGQVVMATVLLSLDEYQKIYTFSFFVKPLSTDTAEGRLFAIEQAVKDKNEDTRKERIFSLPRVVQGMTLNWKKKMDFRGLQIMILGFAAVLAIVLGGSQEGKKEHKKLQEEKERDYPMIVNELSILMGAGMSFRKAIERIGYRYMKKVEDDENCKSQGYEEILRTYRRIQEGIGEIRAIDEMGRDSGSKNYRKLATLLIQNIKKGSKDLIDCLEEEEIRAFELKKQRAIRAGEEASTKLLLPMGGMLLIIIVILVVPAMLQMKG